MIKIKFKLYQEPSINLNAQQQILLNRGIPIDKQEQWINAGTEDFISWKQLAPKKMTQLAEILAKAILNSENVGIDVDADCDGFTSAAILANYLYAKYPQWIEEEHLKFFFHTGKQHGFNDLVDEILEAQPENNLTVLIAPDGGSNDVEAHKRLYDEGIYVATLDHHIVEDKGTYNHYCNVINVELTDYPNKALTGAGVTWKFCQCMDEFLIEHPEYLSTEPAADAALDLAALGDDGDMADYREIEIRALINVGFSDIHNPFFKAMSEKNAYSINKMNGINYYSVAFYVVPFINALVRSGTMEEKKLIFDAMLDYKANKMIASSKRGHKGELVPLYEEAVLVADRVKRRQTKYQNDMMALMEEKIVEDHLDEHAIIIIKCEHGEVEPNLAGLIANKLMSKYQHPVMILTHGVDQNGEIVYSGSARNIPNSPIEDLRQMVLDSGYVNYSAGHASAFGVSFPDEQVDNFIDYVDDMCREENIKFEPTYKVDYIWGPDSVDNEKIMDIAKLNIYGQNIPESYVALIDVPLNEDNVTLMSPDKHPTIKIQLDGGAEILKFQSSQAEYAKLAKSGQTLTAVGKCQINEWQGKKTPQILLNDYEIKQEWIF